MVDLATKSNELPSGLFIQGVQLSSQLPVSFGAFADVFCGTYFGIPTAIKRLRINESGQQRDDIHRVSGISALSVSLINAYRRDSAGRV
jgi:hypothetical protein